MEQHFVPMVAWFVLSPEGAPVGEGRGSHDSAEMFPEHGCGSESHRGGDLLDRQAGCFQQLLCAADARASSQVVRISGLQARPLGEEP